MSKALLSGDMVPTAPSIIASATIDDDGLYELDFVCAFFGGTSKPLHPATIYRGVGKRYPRPVRPSPNTVRWVGRELKAAKQAIIEAPRAPLPSPKHRAIEATDKPAAPRRRRVRGKR